jgi:hypothetical protein
MIWRAARELEPNVSCHLVKRYPGAAFQGLLIKEDVLEFTVVGNPPISYSDTKFEATDV